MALIIVNSLLDDGEGDGGNTTLREAIALANANVDADEIVFDPTLAGGTVVLADFTSLIITQGVVSISGDTDGDGNIDITIDSIISSDAGHFTVNAAADVTLDALSLVGGFYSYSLGSRSGSIVNSGTLSIIRSSISGNTLTGDGALYQAYNQAGAIVNRGGASLNITDTQFFNNSVEASYGYNGYLSGGYDGSHGAGHILNLGTLTLERVLMSGGSATAGDGGDGGIGYNGGVGGNAGSNILNFGHITGTHQSTPGTATAGAGGSPDGASGIANDNILNLGTGTTTAVSNLGSFGADTLIIGNNSSFYGLSGDDNLTCGYQSILDGGAGDDTLTSGHKGIVRGGLGNDRLVQTFAASGSNFDGGAGLDTIDFSQDNFSGRKIDLSLAGFNLIGSTFSNFENIDDSSGSNTIIGSSFVNIINGNGGDDKLRGGAGGDTLNGGTGAHDIVDYTGSDAAVVVSLAGTGSATGGHATGDVLSGIEDLTGSAHGDTLTGSAGANVLLGAAGDDKLRGCAGADVLNGGSGVRDIADYTGSDAAVVVSLGGSATESGGHAQGDTLIGIEDITGSVHDDTLTGNSLANILNGGAGADTLTGGAGADTLSGASGADRLNGGTGDDALNGGGDADVFVYNIAALWNNDTITGWQNGLDKIDLAGAGFDFADFTETQDGSDTLLTLTANTAHSIRLVGINATTIDATDFI